MPKGLLDDLAVRPLRLRVVSLWGRLLEGGVPRNDYLDSQVAGKIGHYTPK